MQGVASSNPAVPTIYSDFSLTPPDHRRPGNSNEIKDLAESPPGKPRRAFLSPVVCIGQNRGTELGQNACFGAALGQDWDRIGLARTRFRPCIGLSWGSNGTKIILSPKFLALFALAADGFRSQRPKPTLTRCPASAVAQGVRGRQPCGTRRLPCFGAPLNCRIEQKCLSNVANFSIIAQEYASLNGHKKLIRLKYVAWSRHRIPLSRLCSSRCAPSASACRWHACGVN